MLDSREQGCHYCLETKLDQFSKVAGKETTFRQAAESSLLKSAKSTNSRSMSFQ